METVSTVDARNQFAEVVNRAAYGKERIILTRRGKGLAAVVPIEHVEFLEHLENRLDPADARKALLESEKHGSVSWKHLKSKLGL